jgi:copper resistance protein C
MRIARLVAATVAATALVVTATGAPALAHNPMVKSVPAKNAVLSSSPRKVELTFLEALDDSFKIQVLGADEKAVPTSAAKVSGKKGSVDIPDELANGKYIVKYHLVADDGDPLEGSFQFTMDAPAASPSPSVTVSAPSAAPATTAATVAASDTTPGSRTPWGLIAGIVAVVILLGAGIAFFARRRPQ